MSSDGEPSVLFAQRLSRYFIKCPFLNNIENTFFEHLITSNTHSSMDNAKGTNLGKRYKVIPPIAY